MKKSGLAVLLTIGTLFTFAQKPQPSGPKTLLWEISGNGMARPSYLFGTMHILCETDAKISDNLKKIIAQCDLVCFELDMDNQAETLGFLKYAKMSNDQKLQDLITPGEFERIEKYFEENKMMLPLSMLTRFKPLFITSLISERLMDCPKKKSMEEVIMAEAKKNNKEVKGIETVAYQAGLFDSIPYKKQAQDLVAYIDSIGNYKKATEDLTEVYRKQDLEKMDELIKKSDPGLNEYMDILLYNRNANWSHDISNINQEGRSSVLFAVGAGHLGGQKGVISIQKKKGFRVKPLPN